MGLIMLDHLLYHILSLKSTHFCHHQRRDPGQNGLLVQPGMALTLAYSILRISTHRATGVSLEIMQTLNPGWGLPLSTSVFVFLGTQPHLSAS